MLRCIKGVRVKKLLSALKNVALKECTLRYSEHAIKNELKEIYSIVRKRHKIKP